MLVKVGTVGAGCVARAYDRAATVTSSPSPGGSDANVGACRALQAGRDAAFPDGPAAGGGQHRLRQSLARRRRRGRSGAVLSRRRARPDDHRIDDRADRRPDGVRGALLCCCSRPRATDATCSAAAC
ncbi:MAG: hypothetical protein MZW92_27915 [Comamonadaceae bacterium]|nr:hypothetical protein [Comamonadaceae bacterium]